MTWPIRRRTTGALFAALAAPPSAQEAGGQALRVIIPQPPGGATDVLARLLSEPLSRALERPVVVENRPGANGIVAINALRQSRPDGGTLLLGGVSIFSFNPNLYPGLPYDPWRDFTWIAPVAGGFRRSSQHPEGGSCDGHSEAAIGSGTAGRDPLAWPAGRGTA